MDSDGLKLLHALVDGKWAGVHVVWPAEYRECCYCGANDEWTESWKYIDVAHADDCPILLSREYLKWRTRQEVLAEMARVAQEDGLY